MPSQSKSTPRKPWGAGMAPHRSRKAAPAPGIECAAVSLLAALFALALLPGLLVVRAPWTAVPALSLAFWALSAWWPPLAGPGRSRALAASLLAFGLLALLRLLPKHEVPPPPGWAPPAAPPALPRPGRPSPPLRAFPSLVIVAAALATLAPSPLWHHAPGPRLAFQTTTARLLVWRDGVPATAEPLLPLPSVGAHAPALATLAADVSHLSGLDPARSLLLVVAGAASLLLVGLFALHATWAPPRAAALGALLGLAAAPWPGFLAPWGEGEALLALAFALPAAALLVGHASRSSAVAAAMLLAAAALAQPVLAALVGLGAAGAAARREGLGRPGLALGLALVLAAPGLWPLARRPVAARGGGRPRRRAARRAAAGRGGPPAGRVRTARAPAPGGAGPSRPRPDRRGRRAGRGRAARRAGPRLDRVGPAARSDADRSRPRGRGRSLPSSRCAHRRASSTGCRRSPRARRGIQDPGFPRSTPRSGEGGRAVPARRVSRWAPRHDIV